MCMYIYCKPIPMEASLYFNMSMACMCIYIYMCVCVFGTDRWGKPRIPVAAKSEPFLQGWSSRPIGDL